MRTSRQSAENHWRSVGRRARNAGFALEKVLTKSEKVNGWIREGCGQVEVPSTSNGRLRNISALACPFA